ncbi:hypothetical protein BDY21DRAFT_286919 [Lineolata rhizophorae]|uniref:Pre-mRNA-splicing factor CWC24 n=1 Tax=Lineolata rhizophorae TaxID=578093 RepID=A0A6A6NYV3_9PEZI|nr:hypothetical protein BDY21DRAFT_286919 [Lineolata rhizophorae]
MSAPVVFKKRAAKPSAAAKPRPASPPSGSSGDSSPDEASGPRVKRRRANVVTASSTQPKRPEAYDATAAPSIAADKSATIEASDDATRQARSYGPQKAAGNVRTITFTDYAPDVCKDYKQTGFCGFGDTCKFLHAREDYKAGWALDKEWETATKGKKLSGTVVASAKRDAKLHDSSDEEDAALLEKIPFACIICKEPYKQPVVTKCGHYFCERCALKRYANKKPDCAACGAGTGGVFNGAKNLKRILDRKAAREKRRREKAKEQGLEVSDEEK